MRKISILFLILSYNCFAQKKELNQLFFDIPLHSNRDSIYDFCEKAEFITKNKKKYTLTRHGIPVKLFSGFHNKVETVDTKLDSIHFQLSTGTIIGEEGQPNKDILVFFLDYILTDKKKSELKYEELKTRIDAIVKIESYSGISRNEKRKKTGKFDRWYFENNMDFKLSYEIINRKKYIIRLEYSRLE